MAGFVYCKECEEVLIRTFEKVKRDQEGKLIKDEQGNVIVLCRCGCENHVPPSRFVW